MPGYEVVGIDASSLIVQNGAIHCITQTVPKQAFTLDKVTLTGSNQSDVTVFNANNAQLAKVTTSTPSYLTEFNSTKDGYKKFTLKKEKHLTQKTEGFKMNSKVYLYQNNVQFTGGDANNDDEVNFDDFTSLLTEYNLSSSTKNADFNGDGITNFTDFVILLNGYGKKGSTK
jgi:hypothetical protein